jgi:hypothetical protein
MGVDNIKPYRLANPNSFILYMGSHFSVYNLDMADLILPSSIFIEKDFKVINFENIIKESRCVRKFSEDVRPEWYFLLVLTSFFCKGLSKLNKKSIFNSFKKEYPFLLKNNFKIPEFFINSTDNYSLTNKMFTRNIFNFYNDNSMTRSSKNLKFCLDDLKKTQFKKKNVV